ncbi:MAG: tetratricopeptide repeat protein [Planctomycetes bacterium]|nr:tetratricopeptide repeat protein [Planctomycetota bacterium]MCB9872331.1 tetratricopeptide repeat protein [Planctomycetota bacterium]
MRFPIRIRPALAAAILCCAAPAQKPEELVAKARQSIDRRDYRTALTDLNSALRGQPKYAEALRWRGHVHTVLGGHAAALRDLDAALALDSSNSWAYYARGMAKHNLGDMAAAIVDYTECLRLDPNNYKAVEWRGFSKAILGDHIGAWADFTRGVALDHDNPWVYFARAKSLLVLGEMPHAKRDLQQALRLDPKDPHTHAQLGFLEATLGDEKTALAHFDRAVALDQKGQEYARLWRYWLRAKMGKLGESASLDLPERGWAGDVGRALAGGLTPAQLLQRVPTYGVEGAEYRQRRCEAYFYLGLRSLLTAHPHEAHDFLVKALVRGDRTMPEWRAALRLTRK